MTDALRSLARDRGFTALAVLLFALTMGTTTGVFAVVNDVLLRPLVFADQERLVVVWQRDLARDTPVVELALGESEEWRTNTHAFEDLAVFGSVNWSLSIGDGEARARVPYAAVSARFFSVAGTAPALGRVFTTNDETGAAPRAAVISDALWRERFGSDPAVIGTIVRAHDRAISSDASPADAVEIVGVMPAAFDFPRGARLWLPAAPLLRAAARDSKDPAREAWNLSSFRVFFGLGRLRAGTTGSQAEQELAGVIRSTHSARSTGAAPAAVVTPVEDYLAGPAKPVLWLMLAGAALMVLLACSSVAGLHVFRAARQDRALAIQLALGAGRGRLLRRSVAESVVMAVMGALCATGVAWGVTRLLVAGAPLDVPRLADVALTRFSLLTTAALAILAGVTSGVWPALFVLRVDAAPILTTGARAAMHPRERMAQRLVVGSQVAIAVVILSGAALFLRSVRQLDRTALGFDPERLLAVEVEPSAQDLDRRDVFFDALLDRTTALPGVRAAAAVYLRPLSGPIGMDTIPVLAGQEGLGPEAPWRANPRANLESVTPGYFRTVGARVLAGRDFLPHDRATAPNVAIVSASAAARYWPGRDPIGQSILVATQRAPGTLEQPRFLTVVGMVEDARYRGLTDLRLDIYLPAAQSTMQVKHVMVRTTASAGSPAAAIRAVARELDQGAHVGEVVAMSDVVARESAPWRFAMRVLIGFGILAALLSAAGLMGVVSLVVTLRRRELGIRAALGATPGRLRVHVVAEAVPIIAVAAAVGTLVALALGRLVSGMLVETTPYDPAALTSAALATMAVGLIGCVWSAERAAATDPVTALRE